MSEEICPDCGGTATTCWNCKDRDIDDLEANLAAARRERDEARRERDEARMLVRMYVFGGLPKEDWPEFRAAFPWTKGQL